MRIIPTSGRFLGIGVLVLVVLASCRSTHLPYFKNPQERVGIQHNQGLDRALETIRKQPKPQSGTRRTKDDAFKIIRESVAANTSPQYLDIIDAGLRLADSENTVAEGVSAEQRGYIDQIEEALASDRSAQDIRLAVDRIAQRAVRRLGERNATHVLIAAAVGTSSAEYWRSKDREWSAALFRFYGVDPPQDAPRARWFDWRQLGGRDIEGAVSGGVAGLPGGLTGAATGAAVGGVAASAGNAARQIYEHFVK